MLNIVLRRAPWVRVVINPVRVQGEGACAEIAAAITEFNSFRCDGASLVDVIVVCRGGGSAEDLWAFNEEIVARAIFASAIPVVSAVGHEIDFTISDFVADLRAPTPSAAAELIAPDAAELARFFSQHANRLRRELVNCVARWRARISAVLRASPFRVPQRKLAECAQKLDHLDDALRNGAILAIASRKQRLSELAAAIQSSCPNYAVKIQRQKIESLQQRLAHLGEQRIALSRSRCVRAENMLRALSPQNVLARGYTISTTDSGAVITDPAQVQPGAAMTTTTAKGKIRSVVS
jgi:exodeoxyribonuclease VII large subunit